MMKPETEAELVEMIAGATGPLAICGGGTRGRDVAGESLATSGLSGVKLLYRRAITRVGRAGWPVWRFVALWTQ